MSGEIDLAGLQTEARNSRSADIDEVSTVELCRIINEEDVTVATSVSKCIPVIAAAIDASAARVQKGGRVIYVGAGTSGRLGVLDASEIPPTYSAPEGQFVGLIAGGDDALRHAQEGAEDDVDAAVRDLDPLRLDGSKDLLIGIAASGRTPYVLSCLSYAQSRGCITIGVACTEPSEMGTSNAVDFMISPVVGPEVVTGSTRMKAGTATKLVLNMLSTGIMIRTGKTFGNMMVDLKATNFKLRLRSRNILRTVCGSMCPESDSDLDGLLQDCEGSTKLAIATLALALPMHEAKKRLAEAGGVLAHVLKKNKEEQETVEKTHDVDVDADADADADAADLTGDGAQYVLCVDGGGSKCAATIMSTDSGTNRVNSPEFVSGYGEAGGCNVTDVGVEAAMVSISQSIQKAIRAHPILRRQGQSETWQPGLFSCVWIALAGYDRKAVAVAVNQALQALFQRPLGPGLRVSNDIELLAAPAAEKHDLDSAVVLVAGTGSVAMRYVRDITDKETSGSNDGRFVRTARSGGWGHLLGDDGSGFDIGRQGIRYALGQLDSHCFGFNDDDDDNKPSNPDADNSQPDPAMASPLVRRILHHFLLQPQGIQTDTDTDALNNMPVDLLSAVLSPSSSPKLDRKRRIAQVARVVMDSVHHEPNPDPQAILILDRAVRSLVDLLGPLLASASRSPSRSPHSTLHSDHPVSTCSSCSSCSVLVLAGGLMQSHPFAQALTAALAEAGISFHSVEIVDRPSLNGAEYLLSRAG